MRALIAIQSVPNDTESWRTIFDTWLQNVPTGFFHKFYYPETYEAHFESIKKAAMDAVIGDYDYMFCCDRDTYCRPERFLPSRFDHHDYTGYPLDDLRLWYASGGAGYWMSRRAFLHVANAKEQPDYHADVSVGRILRSNLIPFWPDPRYFLFRVPIEPHNTHISMHLSQGQGNYKPEWMREVHEEFECSCKTAG